jgi:trk system potassium uptake protein TrkH
LFVGSFLMLIVVGTLGMKLLPGIFRGEPLGWIDALFTATSAVCVTGLQVVDMPLAFTFAGQAWLLLLIQLGGLGMIAFTSLIILALGRKLSLRHESMSASTQELPGQIDSRRLVVDVVRFTAVIEGTGAVLLYLCWLPSLGWREAAWPALFHSISAFCNAGFSTFEGNLARFQNAPMTQTVIMLLIIAGGIGFLTMEELWLWNKARRRQRRFRLSLYSRIVLVTTALLLVVGWFFFCLFEWEATLGKMSYGMRLVNAAFASVTARTAGYNTIDYAQATDSANFLTILLMTIGGSPGSTAGGIKTTTFALIALLAWSRYRGEEITSVWGRSLREETTDRAIGLFVVAFGIVTIAIFCLTITEGTQGKFLHHMFEAASAFNTVGLTMGLTPQLQPASKLLLALLMFLGRVGPLTLAAALAIRSLAVGRFRYAYEEVAVG